MGCWRGGQEGPRKWLQVLISTLKASSLSDEGQERGKLLMGDMWGGICTAMRCDAIMDPAFVGYEAMGIGAGECRMETMYTEWKSTSKSNGSKFTGEINKGL